LQTSGKGCRENAEVCLDVIARSSCDETIQSSPVALDCFANARNDGADGLFEN
jgi:hypothetical protein